MSEVRSEYGITSQRKEGKKWIYEFPGKDRTKKNDLVFKSGSQELYANTYKFILSYPVIEDPVKGLLVSAMDVTKIIHPILFPSHIQNGRIVETVVIDPGHGGHDAGARNRLSLEKDLNLAVAKRLKALLLSQGFKVVMTRETDIFLTLKQRVEIANRHRNAVFVSIHFNSGRPSAKGLETFTLAPMGTSSAMSRTVLKTPLAGNANDSANIALAAAVQTRMLLNAPSLVKTKMEDRGIKRARFSVLCTINHPAILVECGFMSNQQEAHLIRTPQYQQYIAMSLTQGLCAYRKVMDKGGRTRAAYSSAERHRAYASRPVSRFQ